MRSNSFPLPLIRYFIPNSSPNFAALREFNLSPALKICSSDLFELNASNEKSLFERRLEMKIDASNGMMMESFLNMYANPVVNKLKYDNAI